MRRLGFSSLSLLLFACLCLGIRVANAEEHAEDRFTALAECAVGASHVGQRECLERKMKESLSSLEQAENALMYKLRTVQEEVSEKQRAIKAAETDRQGFVIYASKHCESFASLAYGGNSRQDRRLACHIELNKIRAAQMGKVSAAIQ